MLKAVIESWCYLNCTGKFDTTILHSRDGTSDSEPQVRVIFHFDEDAVLFSLSDEYRYMGLPKIIPLTN